MHRIIALALLIVLAQAGWAATANTEWKTRLPEAVRGVWLTNVASDALYSREGIEEAVKLCDELGINTIFVVTWNKGQTLYPSRVMEAFTGVAMDPALDPTGDGRDPLQEVIDAAHPRGIRVIAWFEFGFSSSHSANGGEIARLKPHWKSLNAAGELVTKNGFDWLNALDPEVQDFMTSLVLEVAERYEVDGIQGDDRLPAMPSEGGYNPAVIARYQREHNGKKPPLDSQEPAWVDWRAAILNDYAQDLYRQVKAVRPDLIVSFSPSIYPWSKREYLQDWPSWLREGNVDLLVPQVYRHRLADYESALQQTMAEIPANKREKFVPGVLIKVGEQLPSRELFEGMLAANRRAGLLGEVFFFYEGLSHFRESIRASYQAQPVRFPDHLVGEE
ncbi:glycoside hydrolase family 10 protein [Microbulbifer guangxiensis]|uniref:glycoside hydrolase family 10 protein n=1 Tax=Microbulbifer guangxiensis TaxID=2904249 RepID=UPI001F353FA6|nr:family 10 glycosylhydrolase [Microbulbifer guangxiensis]